MFVGNVVQCLVLFPAVAESTKSTKISGRQGNQKLWYSNELSGAYSLIGTSSFPSLFQLKIPSFFRLLFWTPIQSGLGLKRSYFIAMFFGCSKYLASSLKVTISPRALKGLFGDNGYLDIWSLVNWSSLNFWFLCLSFILGWIASLDN